jgi:hypothetical protein
MSISASAEPLSGTRQGGLDETEALDWIETTLEFTFEDSVRLTATAEFLIHEIYLQEPTGHTTADEIRKQYELEIKTTPVNPPIELSVLQKINELFEKLLNNTFPYSIRITENPILERNSLYFPVDENLFDPPIKVTQYCSYLELRSDTFFSPEELEKYDIKSFPDLIEGTLKLGGTVTQDKVLFANAGHKNTFIFKVKNYPGTIEGSHEQLRIEHKNDEFIPSDKYKVKFTMDNLKGKSFDTLPINNLKLYAKEPNLQIREKIDVKFELDFDDFDKLMINASKITINTIKLEKILEKLPSNFKNIEYLSSDGMRLFYDNGIVNTSELEDEIDKELSKIEAEITKVFRTETNVTLGIEWDLNSVIGLKPLYYLDDSAFVERMDDDRPIFGYLFSAGELSINLIKNTSTTLIKGLLNSGAKALFDISIKTRYEYKFNMTLPHNFKLENINPARVTKNGSYSYLLTEGQTKDIVIVSEKPAKYKSSKANIEVKIDLQEVDILSFTEYKGTVKINAKGSLHHLKLDPDTRFAQALPKEFEMEYYNSDSLRLMYTEGLLDFQEIEEDMYVAIQENISELLDEDVRTSVEFNENLLKFDGNYKVMDDKKPISFKISSSGKMRITEEKLVKMGSFITKQIELPLTGVRNWNVTYIFILPKYIEIIGNAWVKETEIDYYGPIVEKNADGRYELEVTIYGEIGDGIEGNETSVPEIEVVLDIDLTIWFFLNKIVIQIVLTILLIILIIIVIALRRRKNKKLDELETNLDTGITEEEVKPKKKIFADRVEKPREKGFTDIRKSFMKGPGHTEDEDYSNQLRELVPEVGPKERGKRKRKAPKRDRRRQKKSAEVKEEENHMRKISRSVRRY